MKAKHTPGPWTYVRDDDAQQDNPYWHRFRILAGELGVMEGAAHNAQGQGEANARLIAAAPDMLAALELAEHTAISGMDGDARAALEDILQVCAAAIARAGEQS